jgi:DMSO/TMAO reductase YedYZ molybdopterin-dependent catalytic subunit
MTDATPPAESTAPANPAPPVAPPSSVAPSSPGAAGHPLPSRGAAALSGVVAAAAALATGELVAALTAGTPSPLIAVGSAVIDFAPPGSKEVIVALFGTNDKIALNLLVAATVLAAGAVIGLLARRSTLLASLLIVGLVGVGTAASMRDPAATQTFVLLSAALQVAAGLMVLEFLLDAARPRASADGSPVPPDAVRRGFLVKAGVLGALALVGQGIGRAMLDTRAASAANAGITVPETVDPAPTIAPENAFDIEGITPLVIPNEDFYRIDTALILPTVDVDSWTLRVHGMVEREVTLTFAELVELPLIERYVTIACVSNEVGGDLIGNAKWTGVRLTDVLDMAGVQAGATQVVPRSVDGWAAGFPTDWVTAPERPRDALIAVKMNDEPLPVAHGFPARLIVPGLYGYVSATKWLKEIELTTWEAFDSYWVPRGWSKEAPILTQSRIDLPRPNSQHRQGDTVQVAGVAWAMDRAVSKVEVRVDDGEWQPATLASPLAPQTWVQWRFAWPAVAGRHTFWVRATDGEGVVQEERVTRPDPDGARGYHSVSVQVD